MAAFITVEVSISVGNASSRISFSLKIGRELTDRSEENDTLPVSIQDHHRQESAQTQSAENIIRDLELRKRTPYSLVLWENGILQI